MRNNKNEIREYIDKKKRKKRKQKQVLISIVIMISIGIFFLKAPIFNIKKIEVLGTSKLSSEALVEQLEHIKGGNIFLQNENDIIDILMENKYIEEVSVNKKIINSIEITVKEEAPVYYIVDNGVNKIVNEELEVIEIVGDITGRNLVELKGLVYSKSELGNILSEDESYRIILEEFYPYIAQNREAIKLTWLDISDIIDIRGRMGDIDIYFGHYSDLHDKMELVYDIVLSNEIKMKSGYIDISFDGPPVINNTTE